MFYKEILEQAQPGCAFLEHLEAQGLKISANHGGGKGEGELKDVTSLPQKTLDMSLGFVDSVVQVFPPNCYHPWFDCCFVPYFNLKLNEKKKYFLCCLLTHDQTPSLFTAKCDSPRMLCSLI